MSQVNCREKLVPLASVPQQYTPTKYIHFEPYTLMIVHIIEVLWRGGCKSFQMKNFLKRDANLE